MLRLLATISSIPEVSKVEVLVDGAGTYVHVVMSADVREAKYAIYDAERNYLNATDLHNSDLRVTPISGVPSHILEGYRLAGYEMVFER